MMFIKDKKKGEKYRNSHKFWSRGINSSERESKKKRARRLITFQLSIKMLLDTQKKSKISNSSLNIKTSFFCRCENERENIFTFLSILFWEWKIYAAMKHCFSWRESPSSSSKTSESQTQRIPSFFFCIRGETRANWKLNEHSHSQRPATDWARTHFSRFYFGGLWIWTILIFFLFHWHTLLDYKRIKRSTKKKIFFSFVLLLLLLLFWMMMMMLGGFFDRRVVLCVDFLFFSPSNIISIK